MLLKDQVLNSLGAILMDMQKEADTISLRKSMKRHLLQLSAPISR